MNNKNSSSNHQHVQSSAPPSVKCPHCAQQMRLVRRTSRFGGLRDLYTFECLACGITHSEEGDEAKDSPPSRTEIGPWYLDKFGNPTREITTRGTHRNTPWCLGTPKRTTSRQHD